jgi:type I restriction enzyme, S subunit
VRTYLKNIAKLESKEFNGEICSSGFTVIRSVKNHIDENYVFYLSIYDGFIQPLNKLQTGTSYPAVRDNDVLSQPFPLCSLPEQQAIVQEIETRLSVCDKIEQDIETNLERAEALRQSILKKAFEGKLLNEKELADVRGAEDWESAEVLLERIKVEKAENGKKGNQTSEQLKSIIQEDKEIIQQATLQAFEQIDK